MADLLCFETHRDARLSRHCNLTHGAFHKESAGPDVIGVGAGFSSLIYELCA